MNIFDNIYIRINDCSVLNSYKCKNFNYFKKININSEKTFGNTISIPFTKKTYDYINTNSLTFEFYYRHNTHNKFYKISSNLSFDYSIIVSS